MSKLYRKLQLRAFILTGLALVGMYVTTCAVLRAIEGGGMVLALVAWTITSTIAVAAWSANLRLSRFERRCRTR
jgi:hypothetical protein